MTVALFRKKKWNPRRLGSSLAAWYRADAGCYTDAAMLCAAASSQYASRAGAAALRGGATWWRAGLLYLTDTGTKRVLQSCLSGNDGYQIEVTAANVLKLTAGTGSATASATHGTALSATTWYFWYAYFDGTNLGISLNNGAAVTQALGAAYSAGSASFYVGCDTTPANYMNGALARNYGGDGTLAAGSITSLYASGAGLFYADLGATLTAAVASGFAFNLCESSSTRVDSVGALNLTPTNGPTVAAGPGEGLCVNNAPRKRINDQSGNARHREQATIAKQPLWLTAIQNAMPVGRFDGTDDVDVATGDFGAQPVTIFAVMKATGSDGQIRWDGGDAGNRCALYHGANVSGREELYAGSFIGGAHTTGAFHVVEATYNGASSELLIDGTQIASGDAGALGLGAGFTFGCRYNELVHSGIDDGEVIITTGAALSAAQRASARSHLKSRWSTP